MIASGKLGRVTSVAAYVHQHWKAGTAGKWRQDPEISGGGFLFDMEMSGFEIAALYSF